VLERARARVPVADWEALVAQIASRSLDPYAAADQLLDRMTA